MEGFCLFMEGGVNVESRNVLFGLHELTGVGWKSIGILMERTKKINDVLNMSNDQLMKLGMPARQASIIASQLSVANIEERLLEYDHKGVKFVTVLDQAYPDLLKELPEHPWMLYYRGNLALLNQPCISI